MDSVEIPKPLDELSEAELERKRHIGGVTTHVLTALTRRFTSQGFEWLFPVVLSKSTDPLWPDPGATMEKRVEVEIYGEKVRATLSMIIHKMVASSLMCPKLFILSPNVRIERRERKMTGVHAYEFAQLDFEMRAASSRDVMGFVEEILRGLVADLKEEAREEFSNLERHQDLRVPENPFKVYDREELERRYGPEWGERLPLEIREPAWVTNIPREFYDFEDFGTGRWDNYDLFLPSFGEVLSGSRREWEYRKIFRKMERDGVRKENYGTFLKLAKEGRLKSSAGAGIGVERLVCWIVGAKHVGEVQPFPRVPGTVYDL
ncbi:MAG: asparagine synthetase A [Nitrososphaeria archaeon]